MIKLESGVKKDFFSPKQGAPLSLWEGRFLSAKNTFLLTGLKGQSSLDLFLAVPQSRTSTQIGQEPTFSLLPRRLGKTRDR